MANSLNAFNVDKLPEPYLYPSSMKTVKPYWQEIIEIENFKSP